MATAAATDRVVHIPSSSSSTPPYTGPTEFNSEARTEKVIWQNQLAPDWQDYLTGAMELGRSDLETLLANRVADVDGQPNAHRTRKKVFNNMPKWHMSGCLINWSACGRIRYTVLITSPSLLCSVKSGKKQE